MNQVLIVNMKTREVQMPGVSIGKLTFVRINRKENLIVLHKAGKSEWSGIGRDRQYDRATFGIYKIIEYGLLEPHIEKITVQDLLPITEWPVTGWKQGK